MPGDTHPCLPHRVGVIMLDTRFPRPPGDIGHPATFGGRGLFEVVPGATAKHAMGQESGLLASGFLQARDSLVERGAEIITTSCGFLARHQPLLQEGCPVPVVTSSLLQVADRAAELGPGQRLGILALDSGGLDRSLLDAVGAPASVVVGGLEQGGELLRVLRADDPAIGLDPAAAEQDVIAAGEALMRACPDIGAVVFECANLPPYREALARRLRVPVYDIMTLLKEVLGRMVMPGKAVGNASV